MDLYMQLKKIEITPNKTGKISELNKELPLITLNGEKTVYVEINGNHRNI